ncbi:MAG: hypothetical protein FD169_2483 [Bacillota bacterium]|nr:MAG: hypothetical protein FD169_2483 [Bacillota bacterium]
MACIVASSLYLARLPLGSPKQTILDGIFGTGSPKRRYYYYFLCSCIVVESVALLSHLIIVGLSSALLVTGCGIVILARAIGLYTKKFTIHSTKAVVAVSVACCVSYGAIALMPLRDIYFERLMPSQYTALQRPGVDVILGGEEVILDSRAMIQTKGATLCFYTRENMAIAYAHNYDVTEKRRVKIQSEVIPDASIVVSTDVGVVLAGMPLPDGRQVLPLGGTEDITLGGRALVVSKDREPYEVTVEYMGRFGNYLHISLEPDRRADKALPGASGSPVVQNGVIIGFVNRTHRFSSTFYAIVAVELYEAAKSYLVP